MTPLDNAREKQPSAGIAQGLIMVFTAFLPVLAALALAPAIPRLIEHFSHLSYAPTMVPLMLTAPGLMVALTAPFCGWLADRIGRRPLILGATLLYGICGIMPLFMEDLIFIFISRLGLGLAEGAVLTLANVMLLDYFDTNKRRLWLTVQGIVGPVLVPLVLTSSGYLTGMAWNYAFMIYGVAFILFIAMYFYLFEPATPVNNTTETRIEQRDTYLWPKVTAICTVTFISAIIYYVYIVNGASAFHSLDQASPERIGIMMSIASLAVPVGALMFGKVSKHLMPERVLAVMLLLMGSGMVLMSYSSTALAMGVGAIVQQIGAGMAVSSLIFWVSTLVRPAQRGQVMGAWSSAFFAGMFFSPLVFGFIGKLFNGQILLSFALMGVAALFFAVLIFLYTCSSHSRTLRNRNIEDQLSHS